MPGPYRAGSKYTKNFRCLHIRHAGIRRCTGSQVWGHADVCACTHTRTHTSARAGGRLHTQPLGDMHTHKNAPAHKDVRSRRRTTGCPSRTRKPAFAAPGSVGVRALPLQKHAPWLYRWLSPSHAPSDQQKCSLGGERTDLTAFRSSATAATFFSLASS
jgi:hypothetical protein